MSLHELKQRYVREQADRIQSYMERNNRLSTVESTCDHSNWDRQLHRMFPEIANELRNRGFSVTYSVGYGVTDWTITA